MQLTHKQLEQAELCATKLELFRNLVPHDPFDHRPAIDAYLRGGGHWYHIPHAYQALVNIGTFPDTLLAWRIARIPFREQSGWRAPLQRWATELHPNNWWRAVEDAEAYNTRMTGWPAESVARCHLDPTELARASLSAAATYKYQPEHYQRIIDEILELICRELDLI